MQYELQAMRKKSPRGLQAISAAALPTHKQAAFVLLLLLVAVAKNVLAAAQGNVKWTVLIYMLADNNLDCFGVLDLIVSVRQALCAHCTHTRVPVCHVQPWTLPCSRLAHVPCATVAYKRLPRHALRCTVLNVCRLQPSTKPAHHLLLQGLCRPACFSDAWQTS